jgi:hypothetical protein
MSQKVQEKVSQVEELADLTKDDFEVIFADVPLIVSASEVRD